MADGKFTVTLKAGDKFDAPWVVISGDSADEALANVNRAGDIGLGVAAANAARGLQATYAAAGLGTVQQVSTEGSEAPVAPPATPSAPPQAAPPAAPAGPAPSAPPANAMFCPHGQRTFQSGSKNGRKWTGHFCPLPKGHPDQCQPIWG